MLSLLSEVHFWTSQDDIIIEPTDYGAFKYAARGKKDVEPVRRETKQKYAAERGVRFELPNKRPQKLKDKLKELEETLLTNKVVCHGCRGNTLRLLMSKGLIVSIITNGGDIAAVSYDKSLLPKINLEVITDGAIIGDQIICITKEGRVLGHGGLKDWSIDGGSRRSLSVHSEHLAIWGRTGCEQPQPWSPLARDHQRANLHLYWLGARGPDLVAYKKTDGEPIKVIVSKIDVGCVIIVEQKVSQRGNVSIEVCLFELINNALKRQTVTSVPLQTQVSCASMSQQENYLLLGCIDASIALLDRKRGTSRIIKAAFIPSQIAWHESEAVITITNDKGQMQYYDTALNCLNTQLINEDVTPSLVLDLSAYFHVQHSLEKLFWDPSKVFVLFDQGPIAVITHVANSLNFNTLIQLYLNAGKIENAIKLLLSWDFNDQAFRALQIIVAHLLRNALNDVNAKHLQDALGSFHCPQVPLRSDVQHRYGSQVKTLTRRFFHQLVRAKMFETAFLLAVDLGHHDLFMDLHYIAVKLGETEMAAAARAQASALLSRCSSEASNCSRSSCSQCSDGTESSDDESEDGARSNENYLSTNFNTPVPKTYRPLAAPPIPNVPSSIPMSIQLIDLPKIKINRAPPLPVAPPSPPTSLGIPYSPMPLRYSTAYTIQNEKCFVPIRAPPVIRLPPPLRPVKVPLVRVPPPMVRPPVRLPPPLPITNFATITSTPSNSTLAISNASAVRKPQAKVKFSDTVTAFIVPEVKRPAKVQPPAHVTDPQKELADSLPLCHPNEDYLKDFTPIRREMNESPQPSQPKIKVVHFGVV